MSADRRDSARVADALLYIPDDDLVRTIVDGDDAEWSDARSYVPSDLLISDVLDLSHRERPRFTFPDWYASPRSDEGPLRAASALFAALHVPPATLTAAAALHVAMLVALGPLSVGDRNTVSPSRAVSAAVRAPQLVYFVPRRATPEPRAPANPRRSRRIATGVTAERASVPVTTPDSTTPDSAARAGAEQRELSGALEQSFRLGGDPLRVELPDRERLIGLARVLELRPLVRLRIVGTGPLGPNERFGARAGMREAEAFARELIALGVDRERIDLAVSEGRGCPPNEPACVANQRGVRTSLAAPSQERRRP